RRTTAMKQYDWNALTETERQALLRRPALAGDDAVKARVAEIVAEVRRDGDAALRRQTRELDGIEIDTLEVGEDELAEAVRTLTRAQSDAIRAAAGNIETFHRAPLPRDVDIETPHGVRCERLSLPIRR